MRTRFSKKAQKAIWIIIAILVIFSFMLTITWPLWASNQSIVYLISINDTIEPGLAKFVERGYIEAEKAKADWVILEIDTPGGRIDAAMDIRDQIMSSRIPTAAFVTHRALSAGALISLACEKIIMDPASIIGAAEPRFLLSGAEKVTDEKLLSAWREEMAETARVNGRDPELAKAMVDTDIEISGIIEKGKLLTLGANKAEELGIADKVFKSREDVLQYLGIADAQLVNFEITPAEKLARWLTSPYVAPLLLAVGLAGLILELFTVGFGFAGIVGIISLALFFTGSLVAGLAGWEVILLFAVGLILLMVEILVVPGFGVPGIAGLGAMGLSVFLASGSPQQALISLAIALIGAIILAVVGFKFMGSGKHWSKLILFTRQENKEGYQVSSVEQEDYHDRVGVTITNLRPSGAVLIDGERLDVVTEGEFIPRGVSVKVVKIEGNRYVVRRIDEKHK